MKRSLVAAGLTAVAVASATLPFASPAQAIPDVFKDASGNVYVMGATATALGSSTRFGTGNSLSRNIRAGYCGEITLSATSSLPNIGDSWTIDGAARTRPTTTLSGDQRPRCSGNAFNPAPPAGTTSWIDGDASSDRVVFTGFTAGVSYPVTYTDVDASRSSRANECGYFRFTNTDRNPLGATIDVNGTDYTIASLPIHDPPLCRRSGNSYVLYTPASWN